MPVSYPIPSWITPANPAEHYLSGMRQGASIGELQARQQQAQAELAAQQQMAQEKLQAEEIKRQAEEATQKAYRDAQQGLEQDRLDETNRHNLENEDTRRQAFTASSAAASAKMAAQKAFIDELQSNGGDVAKALIKVPGFLSATTIPLLKHGHADNPMGRLAATSILDDLKRIHKSQDSTSTEDQAGRDALVSLGIQEQEAKAKLANLGVPINVSGAPAGFGGGAALGMTGGAPSVPPPASAPAMPAGRKKWGYKLVSDAPATATAAPDSAAADDSAGDGSDDSGDDSEQ